MADKKDPFERSYTVGYGRPPMSGQFKAGQSGNPKGRAKGTKNLVTYIEKELTSKISVTENGVRKRISKAAAIAKQVVNKGVAGDLKAFPILSVGILGRQPQPNAPSAIAVGPDDDEMVMGNIIQRIRQSDPSDAGSDANLPKEKSTSPGSEDAEASSCKTKDESC